MKEKKEQFPFNIVLIGFMGTGKSTIGSYLCKRCGMELAEMDELIEQREGMSISEIFEKHGEEYFREVETALLSKLQERRNLVVSCGGGTPLREVNVTLMRRNGYVILLTATAQSILKRVETSHDRPLLEGNKNIEFIEEMLKKRKQRYETAADFIIATDGKTKEEICEEIVKKISERKR